MWYLRLVVVVAVVVGPNDDSLEGTTTVDARRARNAADADDDSTDCND